MDTLTNKLRGLSIEESKRTVRHGDSSDLPGIITEIDLEDFILKSNNVSKPVFLYKVNAKQAANLEKATRSQQASQLWKNHHQGRITSSFFGRVSSCKTGQQGVVSQIMGYSKVPEHLRSITWGREKEATAREAFVERMKNKHRGLRVDPCGLVVDPSLPCLGSSPDGIVRCECCSPSTLEIKCPYSCRNMTIGESVRNVPTFYLTKDGRLKKSHAYYAQIQGQMALCHLKKTFFVVYTEKDLHIEEIEFDEDYWSALQKRLQDFYEAQVIPELCNRWIQKKLRKVSSDCTCKGAEKGVVITCEKCEKCFHLKCVGLRRTPKNAWQCSACLPSDPPPKFY